MTMQEIVTLIVALSSGVGALFGALLALLNPLEKLIRKTPTQVDDQIYDAAVDLLKRGKRSAETVDRKDA